MNRPQPHDVRQPANSTRLVAIVGIALVLLATLMARRPQATSVADARSALEQGDFTEALRLSQLVLRTAPKSEDALLVAGRAALAAGQYRDAVHFLSGVREDGSLETIKALARCGDVAVELGRLTEAESFYRTVLKHQPENLAANQGLLNLLRIEGRNWEALPAILQLLRHRAVYV